MTPLERHIKNLEALLQAPALSQTLRTKIKEQLGTFRQLLDRETELNNILI